MNREGLIKRFSLFLLACVPLRLALVYIVAAGIVSTYGLKWLALIAMGLAIAFASIFAFGLRRTGVETGGAPIWWNSLRPVHAIIWALFAYCAWIGRRKLAWMLLLADVIVGIISFFTYHGLQGNLKRVFAR